MPELEIFFIFICLEEVIHACVISALRVFQDVQTIYNFEIFITQFKIKI